ncbi:TolC family protein [Myroides sp. M-43]|uniref:TolC family protein n=1 Tax=Myroides oncorhynchi TaxID=2893756 RepID=UPI001E558E19|nr:TolC family protein [Myroides oncorhynchi]MCC9042601.1 TolC family protein [Myroides oncorhynchi]
MKTIKITLLALISTFIAHAQEALTLKDALNFALEHKAEAKQATLDIENSQYQIEEVRANALPRIDIEANLLNNVKIQEMPLTMGGQTQMIPFNLKWNSNISATASQVLFNQAVFMGLKAARSAKEFYIINKTLTDEQIIEKVASTYYQVYQTKAMLRTIETTIESTTKIKDIIENLHKNGLATQIDLDRTKVSLSNIKATRQKIINAIDLQENALKFFMGMDVNTPIIMPETTFNVNEKGILAENRIENRTEIHLLEKQKDLLEYKRKSIVADYYPSLAAFGNFAYQGMGDKFPWGGSPADKVYWTNTSAVGLQLKIPVLSGFATRSKVRQVVIEQKKVDVQIHDTKQALSLDFSNAQKSLENAMITIDIQKDNVSLAKSILSNIQNNYKHGLATLTDLLNAENAYTEAENNYTTSMLDYKLAEIQLVKAQGELKSLLD